MPKDLTVECKKDDCPCHSLADEGWRASLHHEQFFYAWVHALAEEIVERGEPYKMMGGDYEYDGVLNAIWRSMCKIRGLESETVEARTTASPHKCYPSSIPRFTRRPISAKKRLTVYQRDGYKCVVCGTSEDLTLDHVVPVALGGLNDMDNLQTMCRSHNSQKGIK